MMEKAKTHILLVSEQAAANLLPVLDATIKPAEVVLLVTGKMKARADALAAVLREVAVAVARVELDNEHDYRSLEDVLSAAASEREGQAIALNATGGTKLMALAAQAVAQAYQWQVFYVVADTDEVVWIYPPETPPHKLTEQVGLKHYLQSYGYGMQTQSVTRPYTQRHERLIHALLGQIGSLEKALGQLNFLVQRAADRNSLTIELTADEMDSRGLETLLRNFSEAQVLSLQGSTLKFGTAEDRDFVKGGWLEEHVWRTLGSLSKDLGVRGRVESNLLVEGNDVRNELDAAFMAHNRLHIIECKTARMDKGEYPKANDALYKLSEIRKRIGGLGTRAMLASYRPLRESERKMAQAFGIELVCGSELARLDEKLKAWVK